MWTLRMPEKLCFAEILFVGMLIIPSLCGVATAQNAPVSTPAPTPVSTLAPAGTPASDSGSAPAQVAEVTDASAILNSPSDANYFQHVEITAPEGTRVAPAADGHFLDPLAAPQFYALQVGTQYRFCVTDIPFMPGVELFPTIEVLDRTHPPIGEELRHAVVIELSKEDLYDAIRGKFVTRVIYIEDPSTAFPIASKDQNGQGYFDVPATSDPVMVAKTLGRPIVILRIGGRAPDSDEYDMAFLNNCPPFLHYPPAEK